MKFMLIKYSVNRVFLAERLVFPESFTCIYITQDTNSRWRIVYIMFGVKFAENENNLYVISKHFEYTTVFLVILLPNYLVYISCYT